MALGKDALVLYLQDAKSNFLKDGAALVLTISADLQSTFGAGIDDLDTSAEHVSGVDDIPLDPSPYEVDFAEDKARSSSNDHWPPIAKQIIGVSLNDLYRRDGVAVPFLLSQCFYAVENFGGLNRVGIYRLVGVPGDVDRVISAFETSEPEESSFEWHSLMNNQIRQ